MWIGLEEGQAVAGKQVRSHSKCACVRATSSITWELVKNAESWTPLLTWSRVVLFKL